MAGCRSGYCHQEASGNRLPPPFHGCAFASREPGRKEQKIGSSLESAELIATWRVQIYGWSRRKILKSRRSCWREIVDCSSWDELEDELVVLLRPPGAKVKVEQQRARVLRASGGNVLLTQHCFECQTFSCPSGTYLLCCLLCKKSLNPPKFENDHNLFRVTPRPCLEMLLPDRKEEAEAWHAEGLEVLLPKQLQHHMNKWELRGYQFTDASKTMLRPAVEQFASLRFMRGYVSQQHRKRKTLTVEDLRFSSMLSDTAPPLERCSG